MARKRASMREGPLAELFRATEAAQRETGSIIPWVFHRCRKPSRRHPDVRATAAPISSFRRTWLTACLKAGFAHVVSLREGWAGWTSRGHPVEK